MFYLLAVDGWRSDVSMFATATNYDFMTKVIIGGKSRKRAANATILYLINYAIANICDNSSLQKITVECFNDACKRLSLNSLEWKIY